MADEPRLEPRPLWVRCVAREGTKRPAAKAQIRVYATIGCIGLLYTSVGVARSQAVAAGYEWPAGDSFLGVNKLLFGLIGVFLGAGGALWCWLAIRWVDRHGKWA